MSDSNLSLKVQTRTETGKKVDSLRAEGNIPAVLYGHGINSQNLVVNYSSFEKLLKSVGESTLIDLIVDGKQPVKVLIQDYQLNGTTNQFIHADFRQIRMDEKIHTEVELSFIGEPPAVKELSGVLVTSRSTIEIECLPKDLVSKLEVDLSVLKTFDDSIHVSDIKVPAGITVLTVAEDMVVLVQAPRIEEAAIQSKAEIDAKEEKAEIDAKEGDTETDQPSE